MDRSILVTGLAAVFAGMTVLLVVVAAAIRDVLLLVVALPFAAATYAFWYQATGRIRERLSERGRRTRRSGGRRRDGQERGRAGGAERRRERGGFGAGPRFRDGARTRAERRARTGGRRRDDRRVDPDVPSDPSRREAYATLGLDPRADEKTVRRAYRERVKEAHPDRGGNPAEFREVTRAYERLTDDVAD